MAICALSPIALSHMALLSIQATSPERRFTQKEIIAGEERPKYVLSKPSQDTENATPPALPGTFNFFSHFIFLLHIPHMLIRKSCSSKYIFSEIISLFRALDLSLLNDSRMLIDVRCIFEYQLNLVRL